MPIIAVGAAIAVDVVAGTAVAGAIAAGTVTVTAALEVVAAVGATLGAIGAVTGNKTLMMVGAGLGLVGGVGALAVGAGVFGAGAGSTVLFGPSTAASTADAAAGATDTITSLAGDTTAAGAELPVPPIPPAGGAAAADAASAGASAAGSAATAASDVPNDLTIAASTAQGATEGGAGSLLNGTQAADIPTPPIPPATPPTPLTPAAGTFSTTDITGGAANDLAAKALAAEDVGGGIIRSPSTLLGNLVKFGKDNPLLAYGAVQAGGQFLSGLTNPLSPAQIGALNAQAAANQAAAGLTTQQTQNLAGRRSAASLTPVTGSPGPILAAPTGLINNITGTVAA